MAKRIIHECDLTKQSIDDEEEIFTLTIKKKGKRAGHVYELKATTAEKLLSQLNGSKSLPKNWNFGQTVIHDAPQQEESADEAMIREKKQLLGSRRRPETVQEDGQCRHLNKSSPRLDQDGQAYQQCLTCHSHLAFQKYAKDTPPVGVRMRSLDGRDYN